LERQKVKLVRLDFALHANVYPQISESIANRLQTYNTVRELIIKIDKESEFNTLAKSLLKFTSIPFISLMIFYLEGRQEKILLALHFLAEEFGISSPNREEYFIACKT